MDGGCILGGRTGNASQEQLLLIKTNSSGDTEWQKIYGGDLYFGDLIILNNGGYLLSAVGKKNIFFRINSLGDTIGIHYIPINNIPENVRQTNDGGFIFSGNIRDNVCIVTKTDSSFNVLWEFQYPNIGQEIIYDLEVIPNQGGYLISGATDSAGNYYFKAMIRVIDLAGKVKLLKYFTPEFYTTDYAEFRSGVPTSDGGFYLSGSIYPFYPGITYMVKTDSLGNIKPVGIANNEVTVPDKFILYQNYPNPFNPKTIISYQISKINFVALKVYDVLGNEVATLVNQKQSAGSYSVEFDGSNLPSGIYFYRLELDGNIIDTKRMVLLK